MSTSILDTPGMNKHNDPRIAQAIVMRLNGMSLFAIATQLGVTKEWLRNRAGLSD